MGAPVKCGRSDTRERASDISVNLGHVSCTERKGHGNDFELIPIVKMETRHPVVNFCQSKISVELCMPEVAKP